MSKPSHQQGFTLYSTTCALIAAISGFNVGWHIGVVNMPMAIITSCTTTSSTSIPDCLPMSDYIWGLTVGFYALGGIVGGMGTMYTNVWFGRRANLLICSGFFAVGSILSALAINVAMYAVGRVVVGIGAGLAGASCAIYVSEISTKKTRGAHGSFFEFFLNLGILITQVCGLYMSKVPTWRYLWVISAVVSIFQFVALYFVTVECPRRLCANKNYDAARANLQKLRGAGCDIEEEFNMLLEARKQDEQRPQISIWDVLRGRDRKVLIATIHVCILLAYNQIGGIGPMSVYSVSFFTSIFKGDTHMATTLSLACSAANIVATAMAVVLMNKVGRKGFMMISCAGMTIACIGIVIGSSIDNDRTGPLVIFSAIFFLFTYSCGCGVVPWMIAPELLPLRGLAAGSALGNGTNWLVNFVENTLWPLIYNKLQNYSFILFIVINLVGFLYSWICFEETTGKELDQVENDTEKVEHEHVEDAKFA
ncbi:hypothetical protein NQZ79_g8513 [Umbelopsis isabellina]|nr:hypothetical protein NQZ79_g8513 [Umbelopsis isabellina]